jgi:uncharacterized protein YkwD
LGGRKVSTLIAVTIAVILVFFLIAGISFFRGLLFFFPGFNNQSPISVQNPSISINGTAQITYPPDYSILENYALGLINNDRNGYGVSSVVLSPIQSGQQHADSMLYYNYFSHWDTQGYKPYMRYTLLGGTGFVDENVAYEFTSTATFTTTTSVEQALKSLEYQMMYNDSVCCQNGHRDNILDPNHDRVSIGIAYSENHVYFVEDFENYYTQLREPIISSTSNGIVQLIGNTTEKINPIEVLVFFDNTPTPLSPSELNTNYSSPYNPGKFTGGALPPCKTNCSVFQGYITVYASIWQVSSSTVDIEFQLGSFVQKYGNGVYTAYLAQGSQTSPDYLTSISIFVGS